MLALLRMCFKTSLSASSRHIYMSLLALAVLAYVTATRSSGFALLYLGGTWIIISQAFAVRVKERKDSWYHFLLAVAGYDRRFPAYVYVYAIILAGLALVVGITANAILSFGVVSWFAPVNYLSLVAITLFVLFTTHIQLLASEVMSIEKILIVEKFSILFLIAAAKLLMITGITGSSYLPFILAGFVIVFDFGAVFWIAANLFERKSCQIV